MNHRKPLYSHLVTSPAFFFARMRDLIFHPTFLVLTFLGNSFMVFSAAVLYSIEKDQNPRITCFFDALWWAVCTVTSVGYGDVIPVTTPGRVLGMLTMIVGTAIFGSFTALFAANLLRSESEAS